MSKFLASVVAALALSVGFSGLASASEYKTEYCEQARKVCRFKKVVDYKTVTEYKTERQAYTKCVTEYDHCNKPVKVTKTCYRTVQVPVTKCVTVVNWVKVCD